MAKIIEAKAVISATDGIGKVLDKIAGKFKSVADAGKQIEKIRPGGLDKIATSLTAIDKATGKGFGWSKSFTDQIDKMALKGRDLQRIQKDFDGLVRSMQSMGRLKASTFIGALGEWERRTIVSLRNVRGEAERTHRILGGNMMRGGRFIAGAAGVGGATYGANRTLRGAGKASATEMREGARDWMAGLTDEESARLKDQALQLSIQHGSVDATALHQQLREAAMSMRSTDKAIALGPHIASSLKVLQSLKGRDQAISESYKFFRATDILGANQDPARVASMLDAYVRAMQVEGVDLNMGDIAQLAKRSRAAGAPLSDRFLMTTAPSLMQDLGASEVGSALSSELANVVGGVRQSKDKVAEQRRLGIRNKKGIINARQLVSDPDLWAWNTLLPALQRAGVNPDDPVAVSTQLAKTFQNQRVVDLQSKLISQREQYQGRSRQYGMAKGTAAAGELGGRDPFVAYSAVIAQLWNFATVAGDPIVQSAASGLESLAKGIGAVTGVISKSDWMPKAAGQAGVGVGLGGAAGVGAAASTAGAGTWWGAMAGGAGGAAAALLPWAWHFAGQGTKDDLIAQWKKNHPYGGGIFDPPISWQGTAGWPRYGTLPWPSGDRPLGYFGQSMRGQRAAPPINWVPSDGISVTPGEGWSATVKIEGGEITNRVTVEPTRDFWVRVEQVVNRAVGNMSVKTDGPGSTGKTMPGAAAAYPY